MGLKMSKCSISNCKNKKIQIEGVSKRNISYCDDHNCTIHKCLEIKTNNSIYCKYHKCGNLLCTKRISLCGYCDLCFMNSI